MSGSQGGPVAAHLLDDLAPAVDGAVVDHVHDGHAKIAAYAEGDAEAQAAHDGDDVPTWKAEARAVAQRRLLLGHLQRLPILCQLDGLAGLLLLLQHPARQSEGGGGRGARVRSSRFLPTPLSQSSPGQREGPLRVPKVRVVATSKPAELSLPSKFSQLSTPRLCPFNFNTFRSKKM